MELEKTMTIRTAGYDYLPADGDRETSFGRLPKEFATGTDNVGEFERVVFFGPMADKVLEAWNNGYRKFRIDKGRMKINKWRQDSGNVVTTNEIVCKAFKALKAGKIKPSKANKPSATPAAM